MQVGEQIDATRVAQGDALHASAQAERLEDVTLASAGLSRDDQVVVASDEVEAGELPNEALVERRLEVPVEGLERFSLDQAAHPDAPLEAGGGLVIDLGAQDALEQGGVPGSLAGSPREQVVERGERMGEAQVAEVPAQALDHDDGLVGGRGGRTVIGVLFIRFDLGHRRAPRVGGRRAAERRTRPDREGV